MKTKITLFSFAIAAFFSSCSQETYLHGSKTGSYGAYQKIAQTETAPQTENVQETQTNEVILTVSNEATPANFAQVPAFSNTKSEKISTQPEVASLAVATRKVNKKEVKNVLKAAKKEAKDAKDTKSSKNTGKSQIVAAILCVLGWFGVQRFYLGYTGIGIAQAALFLTGIFLIFPLFALMIWFTVDFVRILTGSLQPKDGEYEKTL